MSYANRDQQREYQRNWIASRRQAFFADKHCIDCGSRENLELDHVDPELKVNHRIWSWSNDRRSQELLKCVVRCEACHAKKTWTADGRKRAKHGTPPMYCNGCRCDECRAAKRIEKREQRAKLRGVA